MAGIDTKEAAYGVWRENGQNLSECHRKLNAPPLSYGISRQSLQAWKKKYDWEGRAARAEAEEKDILEATSDDAILSVLLTQKKRYEDYFETMKIGAVDNQAVYGYNSILKTILAIRQKIDDSTNEEKIIQRDRPKLFLEDMEFVAKTLNEIDPEGLKVFAGSFDEIIAKFKAHYAETA